MYQSTSTASYQVISSDFNSYFSPSTNSATSTHFSSTLARTDEQTHSSTNFRLKAAQKNRNERERARVRLLNKEMDRLKSRIPTIHQKTTKLQTLRHAILYIKYLQHLQHNKNIGSFNQKSLS